MIDVSVSLRLFRERNNKTEDDLANYLGIQKKAYKRYESGEREPGIDKLYKLAKDDKTKYVLKSEVKQYLLNLADKIDKN